MRDAPASTGEVDAERHEMRSHAEHGNESTLVTEGLRMVKVGYEN